MPELPNGVYEKAIIHDNFQALRRFAKSRGVEHIALDALEAFNGRFIVFNIDRVSFISTGMGSGQTNCLVEALRKNNCQAIIKIGTCSAIDEKLKEADVIIPSGALIDEGATYWRQVKRNHDQGKYQTQKLVNSYIDSKKFVRPHQDLRSEIVKNCNKRNYLINKLKSKEGIECVWSVDSYDCFDGSYELYSKVSRKEPYQLQDFYSGNISRIYLVGVEMECSALFASAQDEKISIPAAALIVVSRSKQRLLRQNVPPPEKARYNVGEAQSRNKEEIQETERNCIEVAMDVLKNWQRRDK